MAAIERSTGAASAVMRDTQLSLEERRRLFVRVGIEDDPTSVKLVPRFRCNEANLSQIFEREVIFLQEAESGRIIWPKDWAAECLQPPMLYFIREKQYPELHPDELESEEYRGTVQVFAINVPQEVDDTALTAWIATGLIEDDPETVAAKLERDGKSKALEKAVKALDDLPRTSIKASTVKEEMELKRRKARELNTRIEQLRSDVDKLNHYLGQISEGASKGSSDLFSVELVEVRRPMGLGRWAVKFEDNEGGRRMAYIAVHKMDWMDLRLAVHRYGTKKPIVRRNTWGTADDELPPGYKELAMRGVELQRLRHGKGMFRHRDERGVYSGGWRQNMRHGLGVEMNARGKYTGRFERGFRRGGGTQVYAGGDVARGEWGTGKPSRKRKSLISGDEYFDGVLHGPARVKFVDGAVFTGTFENGVPHGHGIYRGASGEQMRGWFGKHALLTGPASTESGDVSCSGTYRMGAIHGKAFVIDYTAGRYRGYYFHGTEHGYGVAETPIVDGKYEGMWKLGQRHGRGVFNWGNYRRDEKIKEERRAAVSRARDGASGAARGEALRRAIKDHEAEIAARGKAGMAGATIIREDPSRPVREKGDGEEEKEEEELRGAGMWSGATPGMVGMSKVGDLRKIIRAMEKEDVGLGSEGLPGLPSYRMPAEVRKRLDLLKVAIREQRRKSRELISRSGLSELIVRTELDVEDQVSELTSRADGEEEERESEYTKFESGELLGYRGDFQYEGRWRRGQPRIEGCFTIRGGVPQPHRHSRWMTDNGSNPRMPGMHDLNEREAELFRGRERIVRSTLATVLRRRRAKEEENMQSYAYWKGIALKAAREIRRRNRRRLAGVHTLRARLAAGDQAFRSGMASTVGLSSDVPSDDVDHDATTTIGASKIAKPKDAPVTDRDTPFDHTKSPPKVPRASSGLAKDQTPTHEEHDHHHTASKKDDDGRGGGGEESSSSEEEEEGGGGGARGALARFTSALTSSPSFEEGISRGMSAFRTDSDRLYNESRDGPIASVQESEAERVEAEDWNKVVEHDKGYRDDEEFGYSAPTASTGKTKAKRRG